MPLFRISSLPVLSAVAERWYGPCKAVRADFEDRKRLLILVIDDHACVRLFVREILMSYGYRTAVELN
jgi:hypothetical protein